jgi:hypothetical protein
MVTISTTYSALYIYRDSLHSFNPCLKLVLKPKDLVKDLTYFYYAWSELYIGYSSCFESA